jgi:hypothetical protein
MSNNSRPSLSVQLEQAYSDPSLNEDQKTAEIERILNTVREEVFKGKKISLGEYYEIVTASSSVPDDSLKIFFLNEEEDIVTPDENRIFSSINDRLKLFDRQMGDMLPLSRGGPNRTDKNKKYVDVDRGFYGHENAKNDDAHLPTIEDIIRLAAIHVIDEKLRDMGHPEHVVFEDDDRNPADTPMGLINLYANYFSQELNDQWQKRLSEMPAHSDGENDKVQIIIPPAALNIVQNHCSNHHQEIGLIAANLVSAWPHSPDDPQFSTENELTINDLIQLQRQIGPLIKPLGIDLDGNDTAEIARRAKNNMCPDRMIP